MVEAGGDFPRTKSEAEEAPNGAYRRSFGLLDTLDDFGSGFKKSALQPLEGVLQLSGVHDAAGLTEPEPKGTAYSIGSMVGQAFDFTAVQLIAKRIPGTGALRSLPGLIAGGSMGFLDANNAGHNSLTDRLLGAAVGAGTIGVMEGSSAGLGKLGDKLGFAKSIRATVATAGLSGALTGALATQANSKLETGKWASATDTAFGALSWAGTGMALSGATGLVARNFKTQTYLNARVATELKSTPAVNAEVGTPLVPGEAIAESALPIERASADAISAAHPALPREHAEYLANVVNNYLDDPPRGLKILPSELLDRNFDAKAYLDTYTLLSQSAERYVVISASKEEWLAKMSLRIARAFGKESTSYIDSQPTFRNQSELFQTQHELGTVAMRASTLPVPTTTEGRLFAGYLLRDNNISADEQRALFEHFHDVPDSMRWLIAKPDNEIKSVAAIWTRLPDLPAPLALEFSTHPPIERLAAGTAWAAIKSQLSKSELQVAHTVPYDASRYPSFQKEFERNIAAGAQSVLEKADVIDYTIKELYPSLTPSQARLLGRAASESAGRTDDGLNASQLVSQKIDFEHFLRTTEKLEKASPETLDIYTMYNKEAAAFQLVRAFGPDLDGWLSTHLNPEGKLKDPAGFAHFRMPMIQEQDALKSFLLSDHGMPLSEINTFGKRLESTSPEAQRIMLSDKDKINSAMKAWAIEPALPFPIAAEYGDKRAIELAAAIITHRELMPPLAVEAPVDLTQVRDTYSPGASEQLANKLLLQRLDVTAISEPAFDDFRTRYETVSKRHRYQLVSDLNSVPGAISILHPKLSPLESRYLAIAANSSEQNPLALVHANVKAGTFARLLTQFAGTNELPANLSWQPRAALSTANIFGRDAQQWVAMRKAKGLAYHDATQWLPLYSPKEAEGLGKFLLKNDSRDSRDLALVARRWTAIEPELKAGSFRKLVAELRNGIYPEVKSASFVREASRWDVDPAAYPALESRYMASLDTPSAFPTDKVWRDGSLKGYFLPRSDERGLFLGEHTNCCQHPGGQGAACAWFGQENVRSGFFVVTDKADSIIAQSWAWLADDNSLVFDSLESKGLGSRAGQVSQIYTRAAADLSKTYGTVNLGKGTDRVDLSQWPDAESDLKQLPETYGKGYTDAAKQVTLAKLSGRLQVETPLVVQPAREFVWRPPVGANLDKPRAFVRTMQTEDDWHAATSIAEKVYPDEYQYVSEGDTTLILDAPGKGAVGYATIDLAHREVNDLAVLPEFRPQSRVLMRGLYAFLKENQTAPGMVWNATLRASTTDRLLNFYDRQGVIKILTRQPAESMQGEPMYDVKFTVE